MLIAIENIIDKNTVLNFREQLTQAQWENGALSAGTTAKEIKVNMQVSHDDQVGKHLSAHILIQVRQHPTFVSAALPRKIFPPKFNSYEQGGSYGTHVDNAIMYLSSGESMRTDLSATIFLTEPDEYDGGELVIETQFGMQEVKLAAGDMILYPSTSLHQVKPVTKGKRVSAFFWIESLVKDSQERETLFDLDQSIQALTIQRGADDPEVIRLSGIYHNLIRRWSQT